MCKMGNSISRDFVKTVQMYLNATQPKYNQDHFEIREHELQAFFLGSLMARGKKVRMEGTYPNSDKRYDLLIESKPKIFIEIEWDAKWTDSFRKRTFDDLEKLCKLTPIGSYAAFFAVNISNKWDKNSFSKKTKTVVDPMQLPLSARSLNQTALGRYWQMSNRDKVAPLLKLSLRLTYWEYEFVPKHNVLVLSCIGKRTKNNWLNI